MTHSWHIVIRTPSSRRRTTARLARRRDDAKNPRGADHAIHPSHARARLSFASSVSSTRV